MTTAGDYAAGRVREIADLTPDVRAFVLEPGAPVGSVEPGSHVDVIVPLPEGAATRSYSLIGSARGGALRIAVKRVPDTRGGSAYMWSLAPGARLTFSAPQNRFPLDLARPDPLLVAGGIGITALYGMARALHAAGRPFRLLYGVRTAADAALADELLAAIGDRLELFVGAEGRRIDLAAAIARLPAGADCYCCGPLPMLEDAKAAWHAAGRPTAGLRFETFGAGGRWPTKSFAVEIPRLNLRLDVPRGQTLLQALERAGVGVLSGCRRGECGLCALPILPDGAADIVVDHRDVFFSDEEKAENAKLCACVSRATGGTLRLDVADRRQPLPLP